jgi:hypothetical protein
MKPNHQADERRNKLTMAVIVVVLAVAAIGLVVGIGMQYWSYRHQPSVQDVAQ